MLRRRSIFFIFRVLFLATFYRWAKRAEFLHVITETKTLDVPWVIIIVVVVVEVLQIVFFHEQCAFWERQCAKKMDAVERLRARVPHRAHCTLLFQTLASNSS